MEVGLGVDYEKPHSKKIKRNRSTARNVKRCTLKEMNAGRSVSKIDGTGSVSHHRHKISKSIHLKTEIDRSDFRTETTER